MRGDKLGPGIENASSASLQDMAMSFLLSNDGPALPTIDEDFALSPEEQALGMEELKLYEVGGESEGGVDSEHDSDWATTDDEN